MRVDPDEFLRVQSEVAKRGERYGGSNLDGATIDVAYGLESAGFTFPEFTKTGGASEMVIYRCAPDWEPRELEDVVRRLEACWTEDGAFADEGHTLSVQHDHVALEFVTWWEDGAYYTGRIEVSLALEEKKAKRGKRSN
jgi:hypothetical protein